VLRPGSRYATSDANACRNRLNPGMGGGATAAERAGRQPWVGVAGAAVSIGLLYVPVFAVPPLITTFIDDLGLSHPEAGALMSVFLGGFLVTSAVSGRLIARFGPTRLIVGGLLLGGAASISFALTEAGYLFLLWRAMLGVAVGLAYAPGMTFVTWLLPVRRANLGVGVFLCGLSSGIVVSFFSTRLLAEALGWRWPFWIFGAAALAGAALFRAVCGAGQSRDGHRDTTDRIPIRALLASPTFRLLLAALFVAMFVLYGVFTWVAPYLDESAGFSAAQISFAAGLMALTGIPASLGSGWLASRTGRPLAVALAGHCLSLLLVVFALSSSLPLAGATAVATLSAFGVTFGTSPMYAVPALLFGRAAGGASGLAAAVAMTGAVTSTYAGGWIVGASGYGAAFWVYTAAAAAAALVIVPLAARSMHRSRATTGAR